MGMCAYSRPIGQTDLLWRAFRVHK